MSVKVFAADHTWSHASIDVRTGAARSAHGGTYTVNGTDYSETVEYASSFNASLIGKTFHFKVEIDGNTYKQISIDNRYSHISKRLIARDPASQISLPVLACERSPEGRNALVLFTLPTRDARKGLIDISPPAIAEMTQKSTDRLVAAVERPSPVATDYLDLARCYYTQRRLSNVVPILSRGLEVVRQAKVARDQQSAASLPVKTKDSPAVYPADAAQLNLTGVVVVEAVIDRNGRVGNVHVIRSVPLLDEAALETVRQWEFAPTVVKGAPVEVVALLTVQFGAASPVNGIDAGRFFYERRNYAEAEAALTQALAILNTEIQR